MRRLLWRLVDLLILCNAGIYASISSANQKHDEMAESGSGTQSAMALPFSPRVLPSEHVSLLFLLGDVSHFSTRASTVPALNSDTVVGLLGGGVTNAPGALNVRFRSDVFCSVSYQVNNELGRSGTEVR